MKCFILLAFILDVFFLTFYYEYLSLGQFDRRTQVFSSNGNNVWNF